MTRTTYVYAITGANRGLGFEFAKQAHLQILTQDLTPIFMLAVH